MACLVLQYLKPGIFVLKSEHVHSGMLAGSLPNLDMHARMRELRVTTHHALPWMPMPIAHELVIVRTQSDAVYMRAWSERWGVNGRTLSFPMAMHMLHHIAVCHLLAQPHGMEL